MTIHAAARNRRAAIETSVPRTMGGATFTPCVVMTSGRMDFSTHTA